jgi:hypothetical protein
VEAIAERLVARAKIDPRVAQHLSQTYGTRAEGVVLRGIADATLLGRINDDLPYLWAESTTRWRWISHAPWTTC